MDAQEEFKVLKNDEGQYSLWPKKKSVPDGWSDVGVSGSREDCMTYVDEVWTDMRPAGLRGKD